MIQAIQRFFEEAGNSIFFNVFVLVIAILFTLIWLFKLHWQGRISGVKFLVHIDQILEFNTLNAATHACNIWNGASVPIVVEAGLRASYDGEEAVNKAVLIAELRETNRAIRGLNFLPSMANIAAIIGLIGTLQGLQHSFSPGGFAAAENRAALLIYGISEAMNHTAFGLSIAVFCSIAQLGVQSLTKSIVSDVMITSEYTKEKLKESQAWFGILDSPTDSRAPVIPQIAPHPAS